MAAIQALEALTRPSEVHLHTDSEYLRKGITQWLAGWKRNGWRTQGRQPVKNDDLWRRLDAAAARHRVQWFWVKGHAGHPGNERADQLAGQGAAEAAGRAAPRGASASSGPYAVRSPAPPSGPGGSWGSAAPVPVPRILPLPG